MEIQSILFSKEFYSLEDAEKYLHDNGYKSIETHQNKYYYIFKIREPFSRYSFRSKELGNKKGIYIDYIL